MKNLKVSATQHTKRVKERWLEKEEKSKAAATEIVQNSPMLTRFSEIQERWSEPALEALIDAEETDAANDLTWLMAAFGASFQMHMESLAILNETDALLDDLAAVGGAILNLDL